MDMQRNMDTSTLAGLKNLANLHPAESSKQHIGKIRESGLKETALSLGAQSGLAAQAKLIDEELTAKATQLDTVYDFNALVLEHNILPPVLLEGRNTFNMNDEQTIRISDRTYKVAKQAHFITAAPHWRQYLWLDFQKPEPPHISMLPRNLQEKELWRCSVEKGWHQGIEQARAILEDNLARIKEDYKGMILYRKLLAMNMVSPPYVSNTDLGITGDGSEMHIDDRVLRITALPALNINSNEWKAAVIKDEVVLAQLEKMESLATGANLIVAVKDAEQSLSK